MTEQEPKKLDIDSKDIMGENLEKLKEMFPSVVKDGTVDVEALRNVIGDISEPNQEYYNFMWAGKSEAFKIIKEKTTATLKPLKSDDESVDFENTENIFIEGDNLEVLKILQKTYHNSIKMIYIDPPYNKDKDFVYPDKWSEGLTSYLEYSKLVDEEGNITSSNAEDKSVKAGRKHSRWLTMMYPRLFLARNLLKDDGVIFISIDNDEIKNLKAICDEIYGEENFIEQIIWRKKSGGGQQDDYLVTEHDFILMYAKDKELFSLNEKTLLKTSYGYNKLDEARNKKYKLTKLSKWGSSAHKEDRPTMYFPLKDPDGIDNFPIAPDGRAGRWRFGKQRLYELVDNGFVEWVNNNEEWIPYEKEYEPEDNEHAILKERSILYDLVENTEGSNELTELFKQKDLFDNPKPSDLLFHLALLSTQTDNQDTILDFFAGSGSIFQAIYNLNKYDNGNRKIVAVQIPEHLNKKKKENLKTYNFLTSINKHTNIAEFSKERIRRVGQKIKDEKSDSNVDTGFKVFKLSESNFKQWDDTPKSKAELQLAFEEYKDNVKEGSNQLDMLYEVILAKGLSLNSKVQEIEVGNKKMFRVDSDGVELLACFENEITQSALDEVIELRPIYFICLDSSFKSGSALKTNSVLRFRDADILFETV